jgi:hypothetical protein
MSLLNASVLLVCAISRIQNKPTHGGKRLDAALTFSKTLQYSTSGEPRLQLPVQYSMGSEPRLHTSAGRLSAFMPVYVSCRNESESNLGMYGRRRINSTAGMLKQRI